MGSFLNHISIAIYVLQDTSLGVQSTGIILRAPSPLPDKTDPKYIRVQLVDEFLCWMLLGVGGISGGWVSVVNVTRKGMLLGG